VQFLVSIRDSLGTFENRILSLGVWKFQMIFVSRAVPILSRISPYPRVATSDQYTGQRAGVTRIRDGKVGDSGAERAAAVQL